MEIGERVTLYFRCRVLNTERKSNINPIYLICGLFKTTNESTLDYYVKKIPSCRATFIYC